MKNRAACRKLSIFLSFLLIFILASFCLISCNRSSEPSKEYIDYTKDNNFEVEHTTYLANPDAEEIDQYGAEIYAPKDNYPKYGFIFYVGTFIDSECYLYLSNALAKKGFLVIVPNTSVGMTYTNYEEQTKVVTMKYIKEYSDVKFFIGGHSQGGGAALRFSVEEESSILGTIFMSPLCYEEHDVVLDNGETVKTFDTLVNSNLPTLLLVAAQDRVLTSAQKADAVSRMSKNNTNISIDPGSHMSFSEWDDEATLSFFYGDGDGITAEGKAHQKELTIQYSLEFIYNVIGIEK